MHNKHATLKVIFKLFHEIILINKYISLYCQVSPYPQEVPLQPPPLTPAVTTVLPVNLDSVSQPPSSVTSPLSVQMDLMSPVVVC